jgi:hypothetical protein
MATLCLLTTNSYARIKLITLPVREHVEIQLENQNTTIVEEERIVPLLAGDNDIDFSWHNTSIKPETIVFRILSDSNDSELAVNILSVSYPPNESALTWKVSANKNGIATARITYAINNLNRRYHYTANANQQETHLDLAQFVRIDNQSGEEYLDVFINTGTGDSINLPLGVDETQEFRTARYQQIPIDKIYTVNSAVLGYRDRSQDKLNVLMYYELVNDESHQLGQRALAAGKFRIYQQDKHNSSVFIGEDYAKHMPLQDEIRLFIGQAQDIVVKRVIERKKRSRIDGNLFDIDVLIKYEIENFKDSPVNLIIEESLKPLRNEVFTSSQSSSQPFIHHDLEWQIGKDTSFSSKPVRKLTSNNKVAYQFSLPARTTGEDGHQLKPLVRKLNIILKNEWRTK